MHPITFQAIFFIIVGVATPSWCYLVAQSKRSSTLKSTTTATWLSTATKLFLNGRHHEDCRGSSLSEVLFKPSDDADSDSDSNSENGQKKQGLWSLVKRLNPFTKAQVLSEAEPSVDTGMRYQVRLRNPDARQKRHVITRITRYLPDLSYQTAEDIFEDALSRGISLLRVLNSRSEAEELADFFRRADPPVEVEVFDIKREVILDTFAEEE